MSTAVDLLFSNFSLFIPIATFSLLTVTNESDLLILSGDILTDNITKIEDEICDNFCEHDVHFGCKLIDAKHLYNFC